MNKKKSKLDGSKEPKQAEVANDPLKDELLEIFRAFNEVKNKAEAGLLDRIVKRELKAIDTSKVDALLNPKDE